MRLRPAVALRSLSMLLVLAMACETDSVTSESETVVYLVRHAEKADDDTDDPPLTDAGKARAQALVHVLKDAGIERVFSTRYERARATAAPLAQHLGLEIEMYDPTDLDGFAQELSATSGRFLVSGHSNTTPPLVGFLGGEPGGEIHEPTEYDRLYVMTLRPGVKPVTTLLRFGEPSPVP